MTYSWEIGFNTRKKRKVKKIKMHSNRCKWQNIQYIYQIKTVDHRREIEGCQNQCLTYPRIIRSNLKIISETTLTCLQIISFKMQTQFNIICLKIYHVISLLSQKYTCLAIARVLSAYQKKKQWLIIIISKWFFKIITIFKYLQLLSSRL